jgi:hypothetical protein
MSKARKQQQSPSRPLREPTDGQSLALLALLVLFFFLDILLGKAYLWEDFVYQWFPFRQFAAASLARGELPLWNPYTFNGMPFLAEVQTEVFYLPMMLLTLFLRDGKLGVFWLELMNVVQYVIAAGGMFLLARSLGARRIPALVAGITFGFSGFMVLHAIHQVITGVVAWYPLVLFLFRKAILEPKWRWVFATALVLGHSFFAGSPQMSLFFYLFLLSFFLFELFSTHGIRGLLSRPSLLMCGRAAAAVVLSLGIAMIQFLPTREMSELSVRAQITFEKATEGSLGWGQILTLIYPKLFGSSTATQYAYWGPGTYWYYWETVIYMGALPLLLTILSFPLRRVNKYIPFFLGFMLFALLYSLGSNFFVQRLFFEAVPGFAAFRNPARMGVFVALSGAVLAAIVLHHLLDARRDPALMERTRRTALGAIGVTVLLGILILLGALNEVFPRLHEQQVAPIVQKETIRSLFVLLASGGLLLLLLRKASPHPLVAFALPLLLFVDLYMYGGDQNSSPNNPEDHFRRAEPIVRFLKEQNEIFRVNTRNADGMLMDRNQGLMDNVFTMEGYTPLVLQRRYPPTGDVDRQSDILNIKYSTVTDSVRRTLTLRQRTGYMPRAYMVYATRLAQSDDEMSALLHDPALDLHTTAVIEEPLTQALPAVAGTPSWKAEVTSYRNNAIALDIQTSQDGLLVLSEMHYPGWKASIDGQETKIVRTNYSLRGLVVPRGEHKVSVWFSPSSFATGAWITLASLLVCVVGLVWPLVGRKNRAPVEVTPPSPAP